MTTVTKTAANSDTYAQVEQVAIDVSEKERALAALRTADAIVGTIVWVTDGIRRLFTSSPAKAGHNEKLAA